MRLKAVHSVNTSVRYVVDQQPAAPPKHAQIQAPEPGALRPTAEVLTEALKKSIQHRQQVSTANNWRSHVTRFLIKIG